METLLKVYDIVYSPNKYRETEGRKDLKRISSFSAARQIEAENRAYHSLNSRSITMHTLEEERNHTHA